MLVVSFLLLGAYVGQAYRLGLRSSLVMKDYPQPNVFDTVSGDSILHPVCTQHDIRSRITSERQLGYLRSSRI